MENLREILDKCDAGLPLHNFNRHELDKSIIIAYLSQDEVYLDGIELLEEVIKARLEKYNQKMGKMNWLRYPTEYYYRTYDIDIAYKFDYLTRQMLFSEKISDDNIEWLKENIPNLPEPKTGFWQPLYEFITKELGLSFKE